MVSHVVVQQSGILSDDIAFRVKETTQNQRSQFAHMFEPPPKMSKSPREKKQNKQDVKSNKDYREKSQERDAPQVKKQMPRITELQNKPSMQVVRLNIVSLKTKENGQNLSAL